jgi:orotate phosphoribosyltransferase
MEEQMVQDSFIVSLEKNPKITIKVEKGHFATVSSHTNCYLDVNDLKTNAMVARDVARELAVPYLSSTHVNTIICIEHTKVIGAYLAEELLQEGMIVVNEGEEIHVMRPAKNVDGLWIFQDNMIDRVTNKDIVLLVPTISSGRTVKGVIDCIKYYGGNLVGISVLFLVSQEKLGEDLDYLVHPLFTAEDVPDFKLYSVEKCEMCKEGLELDALINSEGYNRVIPM